MVYSTYMLRRLRAVIGHNIHRMRIEKKLLLHRLSNASGIPAERIDRYELGKNEIRLDEVLRIACALDVRIATLLCDESSAYMPIDGRWDEFFLKGPHVSDDFMTNREQPPVQTRGGF